MSKIWAYMCGVPCFSTGYFGGAVVHRLCPFGISLMPRSKRAVNNGGEVCTSRSMLSSRSRRQASRRPSSSTLTGGWKKFVVQPSPRLLHAHLKSVASYWIAHFSSWKCDVTHLCTWPSRQEGTNNHLDLDYEIRRYGRAYWSITMDKRPVLEGHTICRTSATKPLCCWWKSAKFLRLVAPCTDIQSIWNKGCRNGLNLASFQCPGYPDIIENGIRKIWYQIMSPIERSFSLS